MNEKTIRWRLAELRAMAEKALAAVDYSGSDSGRITDIPNERTLRYYTTIGLLDRPTEMRGRTGYYSWRHLLQIVAIKKLQQQGLTLVDIQQRLIGRPLAAVASMASLPAEPNLSLFDDIILPEPISDEVVCDLAEDDYVSDDQPFWKQRKTHRVTPKQTQPKMTNLDLGDALLVWHGADANPADADALRKAAGPLVRELKKRGLLQ